MAFRLKADEPAHSGIKRLAHREIDHALAKLVASEHNAHKTVHDVRTHCKKIRAILRLVREEIDDPAYVSENHAFRDVARPLTELRDAKVRVDSLNKLLARGFPIIRKILMLEYQETCQRVLKRGHIFAVITKEMEAARFRVESWPLRHKGWKILLHGAQRVYKQGRKAYTAVLEQPTDAHLHEWRKQSKYLWYQLKLLNSLHPKKIKKLERQCHQMGQILGEDHDMAMLHDHVIRHIAISDSEKQRLLVLIERRRNTLQKKTLRLGKRFYNERPKIFLNHLK